MTGYIARRLLLMIPTLFGILLINFAIIQAAPGGPVEQLVAQLTNPSLGGGHERLSGPSGDMSNISTLQQTGYRGNQGIDPDLLEQIKKQYGFDKPAPERFWL